MLSTRVVRAVASFDAVAWLRHARLNVGPSWGPLGLGYSIGAGLRRSDPTLASGSGWLMLNNRARSLVVGTASALGCAAAV